MAKEILYTPQPNCPNCGGLHYGQRFDDCPYSPEEGLAFRTGFAAANPEMIMEDQSRRELPRYQCHKKVWALKIKEIVYHFIPESQGLATATITPEDKCYASFAVDAEYVSKHKPEVGGYWVLYNDDKAYQSFSPAKAFEEGYTRL